MVTLPFIQCHQVKGFADEGGVLKDCSRLLFMLFLQEYSNPAGVITVKIPAAAVVLRNCRRFIGYECQVLVN
jgi:hypothetical protein